MARKKAAGKTKALKAAGTIAVQSDRLWDRDKLKDGMLHNLGHEPVPAPETKKEYFAMLERQAESLLRTYGDARENRLEPMEV